MNRIKQKYKFDRSTDFFNTAKAQIQRQSRTEFKSNKPQNFTLNNLNNFSFSFIQMLRRNSFIRRALTLSNPGRSMGRYFYI